MTTPTTCTVVVTAEGGRCGKPAVTSFTTRRGETFAECVEHVYVEHLKVEAAEAVETAARLGLKTRTTKPFVLVRDGRIVGYAESASPSVHKRAARLGAAIVPVTKEKK